MKKLLSTLLVVFFATSMMAQSGLTCEDPIPVDNSYSGHVDVYPDENFKDVWYTAWSYDLPMHVYFSPDSTNMLDYGPDVMIDFTCERGVYDDHKLDSVLNILEVMGVTMPVEFTCDQVVRDGKWEWDLSIDKRYRDQLTEFGLTHNIQAFVRVTYYESGSIRLTPDKTLQYCIDNGHYAILGDTIDIAANDVDKMIVLPYSEWKNDSIRFVWTGDQPARIWVAEEECQFTPVDGSVYVKAKYDIDNKTPKKLYPADMQSAIDNWIGAGIFYAKVVSEGAGQLVVERIPLGEIQGDAILLKHNESVQLAANDDRVFCFPKTWNATEFLANTQYLMAMHVSSTPYFEIGDENVISKYAFSKEGNARELQLSKQDIAVLASDASDDYLYVRFECNRATSLTPSLWVASSCADQSILIRSNERIFVPANSKNTLYRMRFADWEGYDFNIKWTGNSSLPCYMATVCDFMFTTADPNMLFTPAVSGRSNLDVEVADMQGWSERLDEHGFVYVRFTPTGQGRVTFTSAKPAETDPENPLPEPVFSEFFVSICHDEAYTWNDITYEKTGSYNQEFVAVNGADSIVTLHLTVFPETPATTEDVTINFGETYEWHGTVYGESGEYTIILQDENGCDYQATLILTVLPEPEPENPCVAASTLLEPVAQLTISLRDAQDIYRIDYQAWLASGVELIWSGAESLHTFVAEDCDFAVAIYHKKVVNYTEVPAHGNVILSKEILSGLSPYVDEDGYLYIRFLTEFEGQLSVIQPE